MGTFILIYDGDRGGLAQRDCCGCTGPKEVLVTMEPEGIQFTSVMWDGEKGLNGHLKVKLGTVIKCG